MDTIKHRAKTHLFLATGGLAIVLSQSASAGEIMDDVTFVPQIGFQWKDLKMEQELPVGDTVLGGEAAAEVPSIALSFTTVYKDAFLSIKYEDSLDKVMADDADIPGTDSDSEMQREDLSITVGYNVWEGLSVFGGYMQGETALTPQPRCPVFRGDDGDIRRRENPLCGTGGNGLGSSIDGNLAQDHLINGLPDYEQEYKEDGWFLGASYAIKIKDIGTVSFSLGYADLDSEYSDNYFKGTTEEDLFDFKGDADGFSAGISWSQPLSKRMGYYIDLRTQRYESDDMRDRTGNEDFEDIQVESKETITSLTGGIQWFL